MLLTKQQKTNKLKVGNTENNTDTKVENKFKDAHWTQGAQYVVMYIISVEMGLEVAHISYVLSNQT